MLLLLCFAAFAFSQAACAEAQPVIHDVNVVAKEACALYFSGKQGLSFDDAAREFCKDREVLDVFLGSQQRAGEEVERKGLARGVTVEADAGLYLDTEDLPDSAPAQK